MIFSSKPSTAMTIDELRQKGLIVFECVSGSRAYGLETPTSDTDIKGVFVMSKRDFYGLDYIPQINNKTNDVSFYELKRFIELLMQNNPNILELLNTPERSIIYKHPLMDEIKPELILSKLCRSTFGKFAFSQIKKAKGTNKKILNQLPKERKSVLSFCFVNHRQGSMPLNDFLEKKGWKQEDCGLVNIANMKNIYGLYHNETAGFKGIMQSSESNDVSLSSIPKGIEQAALLFFNKDGYSAWCREYREYWDWVGKRNELRYENTKSHGKNYDAKNMMHVFRLLQMAIEIGKEKRVNVYRNDRDFLLSIKAGDFDYEDLLKMAEEKQQELEEAFEHCNLPETPDRELLNHLAFAIRDRFYKEIQQ